jgi:RNA-directed DNA polymerase
MPGERSYSKADTERGDELNEGNKLLEQILSKANMNLAYEQVKKNAGSAGIDKMQTEELLRYLKVYGEALLNALLSGRYTPQAVKRVDIPKPDGGQTGLRNPDSD